MESHPLRLCLLILIFLHPISQADARAESDRAKFAPLSAGMTSADVLRAWGAPDDKTIRETRRQERWDYGKRQVLFENGRVIRWRSIDAQASNSPQSSLNHQHAVLANTPKNSHPATKAETDSHLLDSILMDLPKDGGSDSSAIAPNNTLAAKPNPPDVMGEEEEP